MSIAKKDERWEWMKVSVYSNEDSPYGWTKRELRYSPFGLDTEDVESLHDIEMYIRKAIYRVYTFEFPESEIKELLNERTTSLALRVSFIVLLSTTYYDSRARLVLHLI